MERTPRFGERVFTQNERIYCDSKGVSATQSYAARFAAKEAFLKALKTGWRGKITWHDVEIVNDELGAPSFKLSGEALSLAEQLGANKIHLSLSHTSKYAIANVILEKV